MVTISPWWTTNNYYKAENRSFGEYGTPEDALLATLHELVHTAMSHACTTTRNTTIVALDVMAVAAGLLLVLLAIEPLCSAGARYNKLYFGKQAEATRACAQLTWYKRTPRRRARLRAIASRTGPSPPSSPPTPAPTVAPHVLRPPPSPTQVSRLTRDAEHVDCYTAATAVGYYLALFAVMCAAWRPFKAILAFLTRTTVNYMCVVSHISAVLCFYLIWPVLMPPVIIAATLSSLRVGSFAFLCESPCTWLAQLLDHTVVARHCPVRVAAGNDNGTNGTTTTTPTQRANSRRGVTT